MAQKKRELVSTFVAADAMGRKVIVQYYREFALKPSVPGQPDQWAPTGTTTLVTEDGRDVKRKSQGVYEIASVRGSSALTSTDPAAP